MKPRRREIHALDYTVSVTTSCVFGILQRILEQHNRKLSMSHIRQLDYEFKCGQGDNQNMIQVTIHPDTWRNTTIHAFMLHQAPREKLRVFEGYVEVNGRCLLWFSIHPLTREQSVKVPSSLLIEGAMGEFTLHPHFDIDQFVSVLNETHR